MDRLRHDATPTLRLAVAFALVAPGLIAGGTVTPACVPYPGREDPGEATGDATGVVEGTEAVVRVGLFNIRELSTEKLTRVDEDGVGRDPQARAAAIIIQRVRPDILVIQEIDHDYGRADQGFDLNAQRFVDAYLRTGADPIDYPYTFAAPNNTGILTGRDLDGDGRAADASDRGTRAHGNDAFGYGEYPGQFSMAVLSRHPIVADQARTFQRFLWRDLTDNHIPDGYFDGEVLDIFRLSSKSHWDLPVRVGERTLHLFVSHPTPPVFDGEEDLNGRRNFDEIMLWVAYLDDGDFLYDDDGNRGGYASEEPFVLVGDLNADPRSDESVYDGIRAIQQLLQHPRLQDTGGVATSRGSIDDVHVAGRPDHPERATARFGEEPVRVDYVLPSMGLEIVNGGVFWPSESEDPEGARLATEASDHRLVWIDLRFDELSAQRAPAPRR